MAQSYLPAVSPLPALSPVAPGVSSDEIDGTDLRSINKLSFSELIPNISESMACWMSKYSM